MHGTTSEAICMTANTAIWTAYEPVYGLLYQLLYEAQQSEQQGAVWPRHLVTQLCWSNY